MKKIPTTTLVSLFCLLFFSTSLFALQPDKKLHKPRLNPKYSRAVVCSKALEALGKIGDPRAKEVLVNGFTDKEFLIRASATVALGKLGDKKTIPLLRGSLKDENYLIRILVTKTLLDLGQADTENKLFDFLNSDNASVRAAAVEELGQFKDKYLPKLAQLLAKDKNDLVRLRAIQQLGINKFSPAIPLIEQAIKDPNPKIRQVACIAFGLIGDNRTLYLLFERVNDKEAIVRAAAKDAITMFRIEEEKTLGTAGKKRSKEDTFLMALKNDLNSKDSGLKVSSFVGLANLKDVTILPLLLKEVISPVNTTFVKKGAARALRILKPYVVDFFDGVAGSSAVSSANLELNYKVNGQNLLALIINALEDNANPLHSDSVFILGELKDAASLPALRQALSQEDSDIVANAAYVLGLFQDKEAVPYLINVCNRYGL